MSSRSCPCGHELDSSGDPDLYQCIAGEIYGPCTADECGGVCEAVAECKRMSGCCDPVAPLDDPRYQPKHPPVGTSIPAVVVKWGAASQLRWFRRFGKQLGVRKDWGLYYCQSAHHLDLCCYNCADDDMTGHSMGGDYCCCRDDRMKR